MLPGAVVDEAPPVVVLGAMCFSEDERSVAVVVPSPAFKPSAYAAAAFYLSSSDGTPLLSDRKSVV